jgi:hypothetical protein
VVQEAAHPQRAAKPDHHGEEPGQQRARREQGMTPGRVVAPSQSAHPVPCIPVAWHHDPTSTGDRQWIQRRREFAKLDASRHTLEKRTSSLLV